MGSKILVMEKSGMSYVKLTEYRKVYGQYVINGEEAKAAPGDERYAIVNGKVERIEVKRKPQPKLIGYKLYERYHEITQLPHDMPADAFYRDEDGDLCGENAEFYRPVYDEPQPYLEPVEFEVIDRDCEPVKIPSYVVIEFPNNIAQFPETQHKYPCFIRSEDVFNLLYDRVKAHAATSDGKYVTDDYRNIQALRVEERIEIPYHETKTTSHYPTARSRKPKTYTVQVRWKNVKVFEIYGPKYSVNSTNNLPRTGPIRGTNYAELQANLETYIQSFLSQMTEGKRKVCECCRGEGVIAV